MVVKNMKTKIVIILVLVTLVAGSLSVSGLTTKKIEIQNLNSPPNKPTITGPLDPLDTNYNGPYYAGYPFHYTLSAFDPDFETTKDKVTFGFDIDADNDVDYWIKNSTNEPWYINGSGHAYVWPELTLPIDADEQQDHPYPLRVIAKDEHGAESEWSDTIYVEIENCVDVEVVVFLDIIRSISNSRDAKFSVEIYNSGNMNSNNKVYVRFYEEIVDAQQIYIQTVSVNCPDSGKKVTATTSEFYRLTGKKDEKHNINVEISIAGEPAKLAGYNNYGFENFKSATAKYKITPLYENLLTILQSLRSLLA
jgi:hypothetical protein